jgi:hypothetical protein
VYLLIGLLGASAVLGFVLDRETLLNDHLLDEADHHHLGPFDTVYGHARRPLPPGEGVCLCVVRTIEGSTLTLQDTRGTSTITVILPPDDPRATTTGLQIGDRVFIAGDLDDGGTIRAFGLHKLPSGAPLPPPSSLK